MEIFLQALEVNFFVSRALVAGNCRLKTLQSDVILREDCGQTIPEPPPQRETQAGWMMSSLWYQWKTPRQLGAGAFPRWGSVLVCTPPALTQKKGCWGFDSQQAVVTIRWFKEDRKPSRVDAYIRRSSFGWDLQEIIFEIESKNMCVRYTFIQLLCLKIWLTKRFKP